MYYPVLRTNAQKQIKRIGEADLVIGLPSHKNAAVASHVARVALEGAHQYYPELRTVLVNADAGFRATTRQAVAAQALGNGHNCAIVTGRYDGALGQGNAIAALLDAALALDAKAIIILDSNTTSIAPHWIAGLAHLILENKADFVVPRYQWNLPEGALSDLIVYPLFRALWGWSVRHPAAPDFALSSRLAAAFLDEDVWGTEVASFGLPPWLATYAILGDWQVAQSALGEKKSGLNGVQTKTQPLLPGGPGESFKDRFQSIISTMLRLIYDNQERWDDIDMFRSLSTLTEFTPELRSNPSLEVDPTPLLDALALGWIENRTLWQRILTPENLTQIEALAALPPDQFYFPPDLWARIIYDFAVVFNKGVSDPAQVVSALFPLYQGRLAAFGREIAGLALVGCEGTVAAQAVEFEEARSYLKIRWQTYQY